MPSATVTIDDRPIGVWAGQLDGNEHNLATLTPLRVRLTAGRHRLALAAAPRS